MTKVMRFDMLTVGDKFHTQLNASVCTKIGTRRAVSPEGVKFNVAPCTLVDVIIKDENAALLAFARSIKDA